MQKGRYRAPWQLVMRDVPRVGIREAPSRAVTCRLRSKDSHGKGWESGSEGKKSVQQTAHVEHVGKDGVKQLGSGQQGEMWLERWLGTPWPRASWTQRQGLGDESICLNISRGVFCCYSYLSRGLKINT